MAPLPLLLNKHSQKYGIRVLLSPNDHLCKNILIQHLRTPQTRENLTGLRRIAQVLSAIFVDDDMEDPTIHSIATLPPPIIANSVKEIEGPRHKEWFRRLPPGTTVLYTDGSKGEDGTTASAWHCVQTGTRNKVLFEGNCNIGNKADIEDGEIHALQAGLTALRHTVTNLGQINLC